MRNVFLCFSNKNVFPYLDKKRFVYRSSSVERSYYGTAASYGTAELAAKAAGRWNRARTVGPESALQARIEHTCSKSEPRGSIVDTCLKTRGLIHNSSFPGPRPLRRDALQQIFGPDRRPDQDEGLQLGAGLHLQEKLHQHNSLRREHHLRL